MEFTQHDDSLSPHTIFAKRDCIECPPQSPSCPTCSKGEVCSLVPENPCVKCAYSVCIRNPTIGGGSSGPNVGAIAGGVVGGLLLVAAVFFAIWWFFIRGRQQEEQYEGEWDPEDENVGTQMDQVQKGGRNERASVHTVHSMASTVLSRASNMIPIAFIPGVTNRDGSAVNTPPVPPIPAARGHAHSALGGQRNDQGALFFMPGDLRNSAYSATSTLNNRDTFFGRPSITPSLIRGSIVSEVYHDEEPTPAQKVVRVRPNMVSVKTSTSANSDPTAPATRDFATTSEGGNRPLVSVPGSSAGASIGTSSVSSLSSNSKQQFARPMPVTIMKKPSQGRFPVKKASDTSSSTSQSRPSVSSPLAVTGYESTTDDEVDPQTQAKQGLLSPSRSRFSGTTIQDTPLSKQGPFADNTSDPEDEPAEDSSLTSSGRRRSGLSAVIEEATRRASMLPGHRGLGGRSTREPSPFGDEHAAE